MQIATRCLHARLSRHGLLQAKCDRHMETFMKSIRAAAASEGQGFAAVKVRSAASDSRRIQAHDMLMVLLQPRSAPHSSAGPCMHLETVSTASCLTFCLQMLYR